MPRRYVLLLFALITFGFVVSAQDATQTPYPTATPTVTPIATLPRNPSAEQVYSYLLYYTVDYSSTSPQYPLSYNWVLHAQQVYRDINGDGIDDLIVFDNSSVAVMVWHDNHYNAPLVKRYVVGRIPSGRVLFEDWTGDNIPELVYDTQRPYVGTDLGGSQWIRAVIHCDLTECHLVWEGFMQDVKLNGPNTEIFKSTIKFGNNTTFTYTTEGFSLRYLGVDNPPNPIYPDFIRYETTEALYEWNGSFFARLEIKILEPQEILPETTNLQATYDNQLAEISISTQEAVYPFDYYNSTLCQLVVNNRKIGDKFLCEEYFTKVEWRDVTKDSKPELIVSTVTSYSKINEAELNCSQRYIMIYQYDGNNARRIANVGACFGDADLIGVQLKDIDNDGQLEIVSSGDLNIYVPDFGACVREGCWYELNNQNDIYKWNGESFEYAYSVPREK